MQFAKCPGIAMGLFLVAALSLTLFVQPTWQQSTQMVYLTLSNGSDPIVQVELIMPTKNKVGKDGELLLIFLN
jgi:hypothetical protein